MYTDHSWRADKFWHDSQIAREYHFTRGYHFTVDVVYCLVKWYPVVPNHLVKSYLGVPYYWGYQITVTPVRFWPHHFLDQNYAGAKRTWLRIFGNFLNYTLDSFDSYNQLFYVSFCKF